MEYRELSQIGVEPEKVSDSPEAYRIRITSNGQSLAIMENLVKEYSLNPRIRAIVAQLLKKCKEKDYDCYVNQVASFVRRNVKYVNDPPRTEVFQSPIRTLEWGIGDCDDFAVLTATLLRAAGFEAQPVIKRVNDRWGHVVVALYHPGRKQWLEIDTTKKEASMMEENQVYELGMDEPYESEVAGLEEEPFELEGEAEEGELYELGRRFTGNRWILAWRRGRLYRELWYYRNGRRLRLRRRVLFTGRRWIVRRVPLYRSPNSPIVYYRELWYYRHGRPVRRLRRIRWKVVRPHHHRKVVHRAVRRTPRHPTHIQASFLSSSTLPLLLAGGAVLYLVSRRK